MADGLWIGGYGLWIATIAAALSPAGAFYSRSLQYPRRNRDEQHPEIPADVVPEVRVGLLFLVSDAIGQLDEILPLNSRDLDPEWYVPPRRMLEEVFALLDRVGWSPVGSEREVEIDVRKHGQRIADALEIALSGLADQLKEADINDRRRVAEDLPPRKWQIIRQIHVVGDFATAVEEAIGASGA